MSGTTSGKPGAPASDLAVTGARPMIKCPKCASEARDIARFCPRCHATLRYECPSCKHEQRQGGKCEKCGIDFLKYIGAVMMAKKAEADVVHDRIEQRSDLIRNVLWFPFTLGIPLIRKYFTSRDTNKS